MKIHLIAIGGSIMHNLAIALRKKGYEVSGSDDQIFEPALSRLRKHNLLPQTGWDASRITHDMDVVILGMHAKADNPELVRALEIGLKVQSFPQFIYEQSKHKKRVVIAGSHGKTTVTAMVMYALHKHGLHFDYAVGSSVEGFEDSVSLSEDAPIIIIEGDEYLSSPIDRRPKFMWYVPHIALINGIAWDHINVFPTYDIYLQQFKDFVAQMKAGTALLYHESDEETRNIVQAYGNHTHKVLVKTPESKMETGNNWIDSQGKWYPVSVFGKHNLQNLSAAQNICALLGITANDYWDHMADFQGAGKRLEKVKGSRNINIYRDFAHAPSKVKASVEAVRAQFPNQKPFAVLELHTFSSLNPEFIKGYAGTLSPADTAIVYLDKEVLKSKSNIQISEQDIKDAFADNKVILLEEPEALKEAVLSQLNPANVILLMSSGNLGGIKIEELLKSRG